VKPRISVIKRYAKSDAVTWEDVNLNERDVLIPLVRIALAAKAWEAADAQCNHLEGEHPARAEELLVEALDAFDWDD